jgi:hypothetical protein
MKAMKAIPSHRTHRAPALLAMTLLLTGFQASAEEQKAPAEGAQKAPEPKAAVWKIREATFTYRSSVAIFSCSALEGRVKALLRAVGARDDVEVRANDCDEFTSPPEDSVNPLMRQQTDPFMRQRSRPSRTQLAHIRVRVLMPTEVTPEILAELDKDKSRRELVSRVTGNSAMAHDDPMIFAAEWQPVTLSHKTVDLDPVECELLEQMGTSAFRQLGLKVVRTVSCPRNDVSHIPPRMIVEALVGTPFGSTTQQMPAEKEEEKEPAPVAPAPAEQAPAKLGVS